MRTLLCVVVLTTLLPVLALGQEAAAPKNPTVSGSVVAADSGQPIAKARLTLMPRGTRPSTAPPTATSGQDGTFEMTDVVPGAYLLMADKNGYVTRRDSR